MALNFPSLQSLASGLPDEVQQALRSALAAQDKFNRDVAQASAASAPGNWVRPVYANGWVDFSATRYVRYRLENGLVRIEGTMKSGTVGSTAFTLPVGFRPAQKLNFAVASNGAFGNVAVDISGTVTLDVGSNVTANLNLVFVVGG